MARSDTLRRASCRSKVTSRSSNASIEATILISSAAVMIDNAFGLPIHPVHIAGSP
jgi:hypothetical protein